MPLKKNQSLLLLLFVSFLAAGISNYWILPYGEIEILSTYFLTKWIAVAIVIGFVSILLLQRKIIDTATITTIGFVAAVFSRVIIDAIKDPSTHNLWPFEIFFTVLIVFPTSLLGSLLGTFFRKTRDTNSR